LSGFRRLLTCSVKGATADEGHPDIRAYARQVGAFGRAASRAILKSRALRSARRIFLSSEVESNVISLLQCRQFVWKPFRRFCARSRNIIEHLGHLILTLSSTML
jgi:hypothetical protein